MSTAVHARAWRCGEGVCGCGCVGVSVCGFGLGGRAQKRETRMRGIRLGRGFSKKAPEGHGTAAGFEHSDKKGVVC